MKRNLTKALMLLVIPFTLIGCNNKKEEPITNKDESTIIKNFKNTDEFTKNKDYKSIAYAFIYNIKEKLQSYESETNGSVKAKVAFINYDIKYNSLTYKKGSALWSKDHSTSMFFNIKNEFYMNGKEKILVSKDLKKYNVYTLEDYHKVSYSMDQYTIMGYVFNDQSIVKAELLANSEENVSVKYTLDNDLATHLVKVDLKSNGDLSSYPAFKNVELTLSMKKDFTPVSYEINAVYDATKPIIGSSEVKQHGECVFRKVNENITIENEDALAEKLGTKPSEIDTGSEERAIKDELLESVKKLDFVKGVNVNGNLTLDLFSSPLTLNLDANIAFDASRLSQDKLYSVFSTYIKVEADDMFGSLVGLIKNFAGDKLGDYAKVLDNFKSLEVIYDEAGSLYLIPTDTSNKQTTVLKVKLTDVLDIALKQINLYNLVTGASADIFTFEKVEGESKGNYVVNLNLTEDTHKSVKDAIDNFFLNSDYAIIKMLLGYKDFDSIKLKVTVENEVVKSLDASINYLKAGSGENPDEVKSLVTLHLDAVSREYDFKSKITAAEDLNKSYESVLDLKARLEELLKNVYVSKSYLATLDKAYAEFEALTDKQKDFFASNTASSYQSTKNDVQNILDFLAVYSKFDMSSLTNESIFDLIKAYKKVALNSKLLTDELGEEKYIELTELYTKVDYSLFDGALDRILANDDENEWGLTVDEIKGIKFLFDIGQYESSVKNEMLMKIVLKGKFVDIDTIGTKINNLYNKIINA